MALKLERRAFLQMTVGGRRQPPDYPRAQVGAFAADDAATIGITE